MRHRLTCKNNLVAGACTDKYFDWISLGIKEPNKQEKIATNCDAFTDWIPKG